MSRRIEALEKRKAELISESEDILAKIDEGGRDANPREAARLDVLTSEISKIGKKLEFERKYEKTKAELQAQHDSGNPPTRTTSGLDLSRWGSEPQGAPAGNAVGRIGARHHELFAGREPIGSQMGATDFFGAIQSGVHHPQLMAMNEGSGPAGGWLVPDQLVRDYLSVAYENSIVWPRATVWPMSGPTLKVIGFDASSAEDGTLFGGMTFGWLPEEGTGTVANPKVKKLELHARKLAIFSTASNELLEDGIDLESQLRGAMTSGAGWALDHAFIRGTGVGEPRGLLNDPATIEVPAETGQTAGTIVFDNAIKMLSRLHPACFSRSIWLANPTTIPSLMVLSAAIGVGGESKQALRESDGQWSLLTRPVFFTEKCPTVGSVGDLILCDLSQYYIGLRRQLTIERSQHVYFMQDLMTWRGILRVDGMGSWTGPYTPKNGDTQSWVVTLASRT